METFDDMSMTELAAEWQRLGNVVEGLDIKIEELRAYRNQVQTTRDKLARAASELSMKGGEFFLSNPLQAAMASSRVQVEGVRAWNALRNDN